MEVKNAVAVYPNPATSNFTVQISAAKEGAAAIWITDESGRRVTAKNLTLVPGTNMVQMNTDNRMSSGVYTIQSVIDGKVISKRLVLNK